MKNHNIIILKKSLINWRNHETILRKPGKILVRVTLGKFGKISSKYEHNEIFEKAF